MPCVLALIVFSVLGVFSASHRKLARDAFDCVFKRITLRPCDTGFDTKIKAKVLGKLVNQSPRLAKFVNKRFEMLAWIFTISLTLSTLWTMRGLYNYWAWGNCSGPNSSGFCAFDPAGENNKVSAVESCVDVDLAAQALSLEGINLELFPKADINSENELVFMGCYSCDFTRKTYPLVKKLREEEKTNYTFIHFPTKDETSYLLAYDQCISEQNEEAYWEFVDKIFESSKTDVANEAYVHELLGEIDVNATEVAECVTSEETSTKVEKYQEESLKTGIYGTPTVFVNGTAVVGPKPYRVYRRLLNGAWF